MERTLPRGPQPEGRAQQVPWARGIGWGFIGGLAGTLAMDLLLIGVLLALGQPAGLCFSIVGDTAARALSPAGAEIAGGVPAGIAAHYTIGPSVGMLFGAAAAAIPALRAATLKRIIVGAILYIEILSQPLLALAAILLQMTALGTLLWFAGALAMHLLLGLVLGAAVGYGLRPALTRRRPLG